MGNKVYFNRIVGEIYTIIEIHIGEWKKEFLYNTETVINMSDNELIEWYKKRANEELNNEKR